MCLFHQEGIGLLFGLVYRECTDNAIMIAWRGLQLWRAGRNIIPVNMIDTIRYDDHLDFSPFLFYACLFWMIVFIIFVVKMLTADKQSGNAVKSGFM